MNNSLSFIIVGGDLRQIYLAKELIKDGHSVLIHAISDTLCPGIPVSQELPDLSNVDCVILPLPASTESRLINTPLSQTKVLADDLFERILPGTTVLAGKAPPWMSELAALQDVYLVDYLNREEMAILNAVPTAEGACAIAMDELPITLQKTSALVIGYGKVGKILAHRLNSLGSKVTVAARKYSDFAWIEAYGYNYTNTAQLGANLGEFDVIFNTVPALVLDGTKLIHLKQDCLVIDLASKPGGVDFEVASKLGKTIIWALSLPGKCSPMTSGTIIRNTVYNILTGQGVLSNGI